MLEAEIRMIDLDSQTGVIRVNEGENIGTFHCVFSNDCIKKATAAFKGNGLIKFSGSIVGNEDRGYSFLVTDIHN